MSMIEVLVSLTVVAFGLLGLAGTAGAVDVVPEGLVRPQGGRRGRLADRRAHPRQLRRFTAGNYNQTMLPSDPVPGAIPVCANPQDCTSAEIANRDWAMWQIDLRRRLPVSGAYLEAPANSTQMKLILAWQEGQATDGQADPICNVAPVNIPNPQFRCFSWILHP